MMKLFPLIFLAFFLIGCKANLPENTSNISANSSQSNVSDVGLMPMQVNYSFISVATQYVTINDSFEDISFFIGSKPAWIYTYDNESNYDGTLEVSANKCKLINCSKPDYYCFYCSEDDYNVKWKNN